MGKVVTAAAVSLDGYIAGPNETGLDLLVKRREVVLRCCGTNELRPSRIIDVGQDAGPLYLS